MELQGAVCIITGAARGLGKAIANAYASRGANIAIVDTLDKELQQTAAEIEESGGRVEPIPADVTIPSEVEAMVAQVNGRLGAADILVNCAGRLSALGPVWEVDAERWLSDVTVNLYGTFLCCRAVAKQMVERGRGYILNMVGGGLSDPHAYTTGYASSKTAVMRLTEGLAKEALPHGVKVFAIHPGTVRTAMTKFIMESTEGQRWRPTFSEIFEKGNDNPPDLIAKLAVELVSGRFDRLTGRYFDVRSDLETMINEADAIIRDDRLTLRLRR